MGAGDQGSGRETTIVDNEVYNPIATIASKLQGLAADQTYERDGRVNDPIWREPRRRDQQAVRRLMWQLERFARHGRLRTG